MKFKSVAYSECNFVKAVYSVAKSFLSVDITVNTDSGNPGNLFWHFPGLESPEKLMQVL